MRFTYRRNGGRIQVTTQDAAHPVVVTLGNGSALCLTAAEARALALELADVVEEVQR